MNEWNKRKFYQNPISKDLPLIDHFQYKETILKDQLKQHLPDHVYQNYLSSCFSHYDQAILSMKTFS